MVEFSKLTPEQKRTARPISSVPTSYRWSSVISRPAIPGVATRKKQALADKASKKTELLDVARPKQNQAEAKPAQKADSSKLNKAASAHTASPVEHADGAR